MRKQPKKLPVKNIRNLDDKMPKLEKKKKPPMKKVGKY